MDAASRSVACVNVRVLAFPLTGVQRYTHELVARLAANLEPVRPARPLDGVIGHLWEQAILPQRLRGRLLWSPSNSGPIAVSRKVDSILDLAPLDHAEWLNSRFAVWYRWLLPRLARRCRCVIAPSAFTKTRLLERTGVPSDHVVVIPNGVDARFRHRPAEEIAAVGVALGIPTPHYVLGLGSLEPRKNLSRLLAAWSAIHSRLPEDVWLVITGEPGKRLVFRDVAVGESLPRVHFTGRVDDAHLPALYGGALLLAYPALYEGFGLPPLEAMACGVPVVAGDRAAVPEVVGDAALLVDPDDPEAIAAAIERLVLDAAQRADLRRKGLARAQAFNWETTAESTRRVLADAAAW